MSKHTISVLVENNSGALSRIAGLFSSRGYNISSLNVAETDDPSMSAMTIVVGGDDDTIEQIVKLLNRLVDVVKVVDSVSEPIIEREIALVRVSTTNNNRQELMTLVNIYNGKLAAVSSSSITVEVANSGNVIDDFISLVRAFGIKEVARSGKVALSHTMK